MNDDSPIQIAHAHGPAPKRTRNTGPLAFWFNIPFFLRIVIGMVIGLCIGIALNPIYHYAAPPAWVKTAASAFDQIGGLILRMLKALAPPLILTAVMRALIGTNIKGSTAGRLIYLMVLNTVVACTIGLVVMNVLQPGARSKPLPNTRKFEQVSLLENLEKGIPPTILEPITEDNSIALIVLAVTFGIAGRVLPTDKRAAALKGINVLFDLIVIVLFWCLQLVPLAVLCKVALVITTNGFEPFKALAWFVLAVLFALVLQSCYYMGRITFGSWVSPARLLKGGRDAYVMAFSTSSSAATMPLTYECMTQRVGLREDSTSLGVLVGGNFNHDGTALYQAMSAIFVAQLHGTHLTVWDQMLVVLTSLISAMGMAGIPEASLVTMSLIFNAVGLPVADVALLVPTDWFLDRCRTTINVLGDTSVACLLDGRRKSAPIPALQSDVPDYEAVS